MSDDRDDDRIDELLAFGARDYNAPGAVPREEMWARIREVRDARQIATPKRHRALWIWPSTAIAAALLIAVGISIGKRTTPRRAPASAEAPRQLAAAPSKAPATDSVANAPDTIVTQLREETRRTDRQARQLAATAALGSQHRVRSSSDVTRDNLAYHLVLLRHLAGSEAMITAFRSSAQRGEVDAQIGGWSRELLNTTRTLESTQAVDDPVMKRLLEDLDLVITQIVQYTSHDSANAEDLDLIEQSINSRGVMAKLRSTVPGRNIPAGS
jgi:hypothetical protein